MKFGFLLCLVGSMSIANNFCDAQVRANKLISCLFPPGHLLALCWSDGTRAVRVPVPCQDPDPQGRVGTAEVLGVWALALAPSGELPSPRIKDVLVRKMAGKK